jgi:DNA-directed RNA polymerase specialized sigma24 family protein
MSPDKAAAHRRFLDRSVDVESTLHLIERVRAGDREALERLFARHLEPLQRWARGCLPRWARDLADTEDLVQDTLAQTFRIIEDFEARGAGALQAYLRQAVLNRIRNELRRKGRQPQAAPRTPLGRRSRSPDTRIPSGAGCASGRCPPARNPASAASAPTLYAWSCHEAMLPVWTRVARRHPRRPSWWCAPMP